MPPRQPFRKPPVNWQCPDFISLPEWDFTCGCSTSTIGPACGRTLQLLCLELKTRPTSVCHLMLGHVCGCVSTEAKVIYWWYYPCLSWKFPVDCSIANWKLQSTDWLCSCLVHKVRESAWLRANLPKKLRYTSFWPVHLSVVASTKKGQRLIAGSRLGNTGPSLPFRKRTCSTLRWNQSHFPKAFCKTCLGFFLSSGRYRIMEQPRFEGAL